MKSSSDPRHNARKLALGSLFCWLFSEPDYDSCKEITAELLGFDTESVDYELTDKIIEGITKHRGEIDRVIQECAPEWPIDKISKVDLIILRIAVFEILHNSEVPDKVVIDEAVELAKEFGSETAQKFVNGVLGTVVEIKENTKDGS